nr:7487_t:CDS:2 [Entrophospora candida]
MSGFSATPILFTLNSTFNNQLDHTSNQVVLGDTSTLKIEGYSNNTFIKDGSKIKVTTFYNGTDIDYSIVDFCSTFTVICLLDNNNDEDYNVTTATTTSPFIDSPYYPYNFNYIQTTFISRPPANVIDAEFQQLILVADPDDNTIGCTNMNVTVVNSPAKKPTNLKIPTKPKV